MTKELKFKVGDKAILKDSTFSINPNMIGQEVEIIEVDDSGVPYKVKFKDNCDTYWLLEKRLAPIDAKESNSSDELKIGDKVKILNVEGTFWSEHVIGKIGTVIKIDDDSVPYFVEIEGHKSGQWVRHDYIAKIEQLNPLNELLIEAEKIVRIKLSNIQSENRTIQNKIDGLQQKLKDNQEYIDRLSTILKSLES